MKTICVYCGSELGAGTEYAHQAYLLGRAIVSTGHELVYGGGKAGLMGIIANSVLDAGGAVTGVIPEALVQRELAHPGLTKLIVVRTMHTRKAVMEALSDAFVALPGGIGTFDEVFDLAALLKLGMSKKPLGLLNVASYYDSLIHFLNHSVREGFLHESDRSLILDASDPKLLIQKLTGIH